MGFVLLIIIFGGAIGIVGFLVGMNKTMVMMEENSRETVQFFPTTDTAMKVVEEVWFVKHALDYKTYLEKPEMWREYESDRSGNHSDGSVDSGNDPAIRSDHDVPRTSAI